jgi:hypothetical protein
MSVQKSDRSKVADPNAPLDFLEKLYDQWGYNLRSDFFIEIRKILKEAGRLKVEYTK